MRALLHFSGDAVEKRNTALREDRSLLTPLFGVPALFFSCILFLLFCRSLAWGISEIPTSFQGENPFQTETEAHEITGSHSPGNSFSAGVRLEGEQGLKVAGLQDSQKEPPPEAGPKKQVQEEDNWMEEGESQSPLPDPLEPVNRAFFHFNDKLYFWFLKPIGQGYEIALPLLARVSIRNFFSNLMMPVRAVSCLLQGKFKGFGIELTRFMVNTSAGFLGFQDVAKIALDMPLQDEDLGQVLAFYGIGPGFYLELPLLGPTTLRGAVGWGGQLYMNPLNYLLDDWWSNLTVRTLDIVNNTSLRIGEYEALKEASLDPYIALRDAYYQFRLSQIEK